jgi:hypothetical protein
MPVKYTTQLASRPGENIYFVADTSSSPLDIFAAAAMYNKKRGYRFRPWTRRSGVGQYNANLVAYQPFMKADSVVTGTIDVWKAQQELSERDRKIILANSAAGMLAAPAAIYGSVKAARAREGGIPRTLVRGAATKGPAKNTKLARKIDRGLKVLETGTGKKALVASGVLGASSIGVQLAGTLGDVIANRATRKKKER